MQPSREEKQGINAGRTMQLDMASEPMIVDSDNNNVEENVVTTIQTLEPGPPAFVPNVQILSIAPVAPTVTAQYSAASCTVSSSVVGGTLQVIGTQPANADHPDVITMSTSAPPPEAPPNETQGQKKPLARASGSAAVAARLPFEHIKLTPGNDKIKMQTRVFTPSTSGLLLEALPNRKERQTGPKARASGPVITGARPLVLERIEKSSTGYNAYMPPAMFEPPPRPLSPETPPTPPNERQGQKKPKARASSSAAAAARPFLSEEIESPPEGDNANMYPCMFTPSTSALLSEAPPIQKQSQKKAKARASSFDASIFHSLLSEQFELSPEADNANMKSVPRSSVKADVINPPRPHEASAAELSPCSSRSGQTSWDEDRKRPELTPLLPMALPDLMEILQPEPSQNTEQPTEMPTDDVAVTVLQNIPVPIKSNANEGSKGHIQGKGPSTSSISTVPGGKSKDKERKSSGQSLPQQCSDDKMAGDDDINDVAAMGGVNLAEETQKILGSTEKIGSQIRSCKDEYLVSLPVMQARLKSIVTKNGLEDSTPEVSSLLIHATEERLKTAVEKLAIIAEHRMDLAMKDDSRYEVTQDVKGQLKFLEELDRVEKKRQEDAEREVLLRAAKSRSKNENPEQAKLKAKAKEMQRAELEELRQREANVTALQAIGPRKRPRLDEAGGSGDTVASNSEPSGSGQAGRSQLAPRIKRVTLRDMMFLLENDRHTARSLMLYKSYLK